MPNWNSSAPYEVIAGPATIYRAPAGTARPSIATYPLVEPAGDWVKVGTNGDLNYDEQGVRISSPQEINKWKALGDTGSRKAFRVNEDFMVGFKVVDLKLDIWARALNENTIGTTAAGAAAGHSKIGLSRGPGVAAIALLVRFPSPFGADLWAQIWLPRAINEAAVEAVFQKGTPVGLDLEFSSMVYEAASSEEERFGVLEAQTEPPTS